LDGERIFTDSRPWKSASKSKRDPGDLPKNVVIWNGTDYHPHSTILGYSRIKMAKTTADKLAKAKEGLKTAQVAGGALLTVREAKKKVKRAQRRTKVELTAEKRRQAAKDASKPKAE
jgi:hypothetical protein